MNNPFGNETLKAQALPYSKTGGIKYVCGVRTCNEILATRETGQDFWQIKPASRYVFREREKIFARTNRAFRSIPKLREQTFALDTTDQNFSWEGSLLDALSTRSPRLDHALKHKRDHRPEQNAWGADVMEEGIAIGQWMLNGSTGLPPIDVKSAVFKCAQCGRLSKLNDD